MKFLETDIEYFRNVIEKMLEDSGYCSVKKIYGFINVDDPVRLKRLYISYQYSLFSVLEYLFSEEYQFLRPYIARYGVIVENPKERIDELVKSSETIMLSDVRELAKEMHYSINNLLNFANEHNDTHLLINDNQLMMINLIGLNKKSYEQLEEGIINELNELNDTAFISQLKTVYALPHLSVPWTEWLIYSILYKWSKRLDVGIVSSTSVHQLKHSSPIVALKGQLRKLKVSTDEDFESISAVDDLNNIDSLIEDIVVKEIGDF